MKALVQRLSSNPSYGKAIEWGKIVTITGSAQIVVQGISFLSGILVIRLLPIQEYAVYTLANTMLVNMTVLADSGIKTSVMAEGGKVWRDRERLGAVLVTGLRLRRQFAIGSLLIAIPVLLYLLLHHAISLLMSLLTIASLIPSFYTTLSGSLLEIAPKLWQKIAPLQKIQVGTAVGRIAIIGLTLFTLPWAFVAVLAAGLPQIWANRRLRSLSRVYADDGQQPDPDVRKKILAMVRRLMPDSIYSCISGQITIWLISIFGSMVAVAQVGALSRLAMILYFFNVMFGVLVTPRFARFPNDQELLLNRYIQIHIGMLLLCAGIIGITWLYSSEMLWILGPSYAGLKTEVFLMMIGSCIGLIAQSTFFLCTSKGWVIHPAISIPVNIASIAIGAAVFDISTLKGIFILNIFINTIMVVVHGVYGYSKIRSIKEEYQY